MNRIIIHCGNGRGKSSSGFGVVVRALAHGRKVLVVQFFKPEMDAALKYLLENSDGRLTVKNYGSWYFKDRPDVDAALVYQNALRDIYELIRNDGFDTVMLDEIFYTVDFNLLEAGKIIELIEAFDNKCFVLTGRNAPCELLKIADTVSRIECEKHAFERGIKAQKGVEF
ncbi:MAG: cob(I)yrinic acid a,c-diamide adenosyltransferase [Lentisphaeria bacterium]|nr:cob(I)yrinic acid a,c-diamide adenosyltransferase [Lentisphaeria bacterium]